MSCSVLRHVGISTDTLERGEVEDITTKTVKQAQQYLDDATATLIRYRDQIDRARRRIHEFAPSTREYEQAEVSLTLAEIDSEFYSKCASTSDPSAMASRQGVPTEVVLQWAQLVPETGAPHVVRLVVERDGETRGYAIPFRNDRQSVAEELMGRFRDTLVRKGWIVTFFGGAPKPDADDFILADA